MMARSPVSCVVVTSVPAILTVVVTICVHVVASSLVFVTTVVDVTVLTCGLSVEPRAEPNAYAAINMTTITALYLRSFDVVILGPDKVASRGDGVDAWSVRPHSRQNRASAETGFPHTSQNGIGAPPLPRCLSILLDMRIELLCEFVRIVGLPNPEHQPDKAKQDIYREYKT